MLLQERVHRGRGRYRGGNPHSDADHPAQRGEHHRLHQELPQDIAAAAPTARRMPISRVRSVTETSMMFMMPTPPTTSETLATEPKSKVMTMVMIRSTLSDFGRVVHGEIVLVAVADAMALAQQQLHLVFGIVHADRPSGPRPGSRPRC